MCTFMFGSVTSVELALGRAHLVTRLERRVIADIRARPVEMVYQSVLPFISLLVRAHVSVLSSAILAVFVCANFLS